MPRSKPFVVATEGQTIDGRNISREWIQQMAAKYSPSVYTAVANLEHFLSFQPNSEFSAQGTVVTLSTQEATILGEKKMQLLAVVDASDAVVEMQKAGKKLFASIEVAANFVGKGFAYLTGLAFTDTPASLGTESMKFSAGKEGIFSFGDEVTIEWETAAAEPSAGESLFSKVKNLLGLKDKKDDERFADTNQAVELVATSQKELLEKFSAIQKELDAANKTIDELKAQAEKDRTEFSEFKALMDKTGDGTAQRPPASGGQGKGTPAIY